MKKMMRRALVLLVLVCMVIVMAVPAMASENSSANSAVTDDAEGVVLVKVVYTDDSGNDRDVQWGTGFVINDTTILTCDHVVRITDKTLTAVAEHFGKTKKQAMDRIKVVVNAVYDMTIDAKVVNESKKIDFAILSVKNPVGGKVLPIRSSSEVNKTENVYALGFPGVTTVLKAVKKYTSKDVNISPGGVNDVTAVNTGDGDVDYIVSGVTLSEGNSGGPLVDSEGNVVGINQGVRGEGFNKDYSYAIAIDQVTEALDKFHIEYTEAGTPEMKVDDTQELEGGQTEEQEGTQEPAEPTKEEKDQEAAAAVEKTLNGLPAAKDVNAEVDKAGIESARSAYDSLSEDQKKLVNSDAAKKLTDAEAALENPINKLPFSPVILIVIVVIVVVVVVLIIVMTMKKKGGKNNGMQNSNGGYNPVDISGAGNGRAPQQYPNTGTQGKPVQPVQPQYGGSPETSVLSNAGETTLLSQGSNETTVLNQNKVYGRLTRKKNGETVTINKDNFKIGKERSKVDYCVIDNGAVSRLHATIIHRNGSAFILDQNSKNCTFVNNVKATPNVEVPIKNGDTITLADEDFTYHA